MKPLYVIAAIAVTMLCWGVYGPVLHPGQEGFAAGNKIALDDGLRAFMCVGMAYFFIAIVAPVVMLKLYGESGNWSAGGLAWSLIAGAVGAIGALGVILAFGFGGKPVFVMPLVFGGAPVVNSFLTMYWSKSFKQISPLFLAGLIMVAIGAVTVLSTKPRPQKHAAEAAVSAAAEAEHAAADASATADSEWTSMLKVIPSVALIIVCWGAYGPVLHRGQMKMSGSRLRPLICVGISYFAIAVVVPWLILSADPGDGSFQSFSGVTWSLFAGAAGALGALGIIYAFNFGGKPIYVMPLVFGGAPVVNTMVSMAKTGASSNPFFYAGLILVAAGAIVVLVFAPKGGHGPPAAAKTDAPALDTGAERSAEAGSDAASSDAAAKPDSSTTDSNSTNSGSSEST